MNRAGQEPRVGQLFTHLDARGGLGVAESSDVPFIPRRFFWLFGVMNGETRANHGHRECEQFVFVQYGSVRGFTLDSAGSRFDFSLGVADYLYVPVRHWLQLSDFSPDAIIGVLASHSFNADEYIDSPLELDT
jgi:UDP-2-acetamido-3-amino-2,3-dideoxy-glucuronate N-acetyltransferase